MGCVGGWGRNTCCNRNGHYNTLLDRKCVCVRVCDNAGKQKRKTETSVVQHQTIIYLIRSTRVTQSQNFDFWFEWPRNARAKPHWHIEYVFMYISNVIYNACVCVCTHIVREIWKTNMGGGSTTNKACEWTESAQPTIVVASLFFLCQSPKNDGRQSRQADKQTSRRADRQTSRQADRETDWQAHVNQRTET